MRHPAAGVAPAVTAPAAVATPARSHVRTTAGHRPPPRAAATPGPGISAQASFLAASFADHGGLAEHGEPTLEQADRQGALAVAGGPSRDAVPPTGHGGARIHWVAPPGALVAGSLLDLQRLAGNAAVAAMFGHGRGRGGVTSELGSPRDTPTEVSGHDTDADVAVQRINIPGLGEIDVSGYLGRGTSTLKSAESSTDKARSDARKGADEAAGEADEKVVAGTGQMEAGKTQAESACESMFSGTTVAAAAAASAEQARTSAAKAKGDRTAEKVHAVAPVVEGLVDPLAPAVGSPEVEAGHTVLDEAVKHAVGQETPGAAVPPGAEPAVSHTAGPPAPGPGPPGQAAPGAEPAVAHTAGPPAPAAEPSGPAAPGTDQTPQPIQQAGGDERSCALVEAAKSVKGLRDTAVDLARGVVAGIADTEIPILGVKVGTLANKAKDAAVAIATTLGEVKDAAVAGAKSVAATVKKKIASAAKAARQSFDTAATCVKQTIRQAKDAVVAGWNVAKTKVGNLVTAAKRGAAVLARRAISRVQGWVGDINPRILSLLGSVGTRLRQFAAAKDPLGDAAAYLERKKAEAQKRLREAKKTAVKVARAVADTGVKTAAKLYQDAKSGAAVVAGAAKAAAPYVAGLVAPGVVAVAGAAKKAADAWGDDIRAGADWVKQKLKGEACEALSETVGPCIDMYMPKPDNNDKSFARLTGQADITVPLQELDVPCNVKMGRSAAVGVERTSTGYTVSVDGEATVFANLAAGEKGAKEEVKVQLPTGHMATVWEKLGGGSPAPLPGGPPAAVATGGAPAAPASAAPAPGAAAPAPATSGTGAGTPTQGAQGQGGPGVAGEIEGGVKGSASLKFSFPTSKDATTCTAAGGVAALLGELGVAAMLPSPLDVIARGGVVGSWQGNLVSNTVTMGLAGGGQAELSKDGLGALKGSGQADLYVTTGVERTTAGDPATLRPTLKVGAGLKGELAAELAVPKLPAAKGSVTAAGKVEATLLWDRKADRIFLQSVTGEAEVGLAAGGFNPAALAAAAAPPMGAVAAAKLTSLGLSYSSGSIKGKVTGKANNLQKYIDAADGYISSSGSSASAAGLVKAIQGQYRASDFSTGVTITATLSKQVAGAEGKAEEIGDEGMKAGASAKASLEVGKEYQLYP